MKWEEGKGGSRPKRGGERGRGEGRALASVSGDVTK